MNTKHNKISFTVEYEADNLLPFLNVMIFRVGNGFITHVYRKDTFTGLGLNYMSFMPHIFKVNSIKTLICRAFSICCSWSNFDMYASRHN